MEPKRKRGPAPEFNKPVSLYENAEGMSLLKELARRRGLSQAALVRTLIREEAARIGLEPGAG
jgi:hypothetical protein